ncbi:DegT/DnrJ/EryC1/StrS family aminotransferase [Ningiella sp. W23]|uniref:DegT/DnrJ/EryC1/StrS family aminotransferase n=1 Tax=Ningiella sp. W23 TaxID=3023715 RepID=UPI0037565B7C
MLNGPFSSWPSYCDEEKNAVMAILDSNKVNYWTGTAGREFEKEFAHFANTNYAVAVANGSVALDLAWKALDMPPGSEIIVTSRTFLASVSSIVLAGYVPVFADISRDSQNVTYDTIQQCISEKTACILCVHLAGWPCEMDDILELAKAHNLFVVEDCAQAHGAKYKGRSVGSFGDIGAWSFCQDKIMSTAGEGGMVTTNDKSLWETIWSYKDHGKSYSAVYEKSHPPGFRWLHESFGTNWRMTEIQSAVGRIQLQKMPDWTTKRRHYATAILDVARKYSAIRVPDVPKYVVHAFYKCYVFVEQKHLRDGWDRDKIMASINERGVPCFSGSCSEVYLEKAFDNTPFRPKKSLPIAKELGETSLMFLVHPTLSEKEIEKTCRVIEEVFQEACV